MNEDNMTTETSARSISGIISQFIEERAIKETFKTLWNALIAPETFIGDGVKGLASEIVDTLAESDVPSEFACAYRYELRLLVSKLDLIMATISKLTEYELKTHES